MQQRQFGIRRFCEHCAFSASWCPTKSLVLMLVRLTSISKFHLCAQPHLKSRLAQKLHSEFLVTWTSPWSFGSLAVKRPGLAIWSETWRSASARPFWPLFCSLAHVPSVIFVTLFMFQTCWCCPHLLSGVSMVFIQSLVPCPSSTRIFLQSQAGVLQLRSPEGICANTRAFQCSSTSGIHSCCSGCCVDRLASRSSRWVLELQHDRPGLFDVSWLFSEPPVASGNEVCISQSMWAIIHHV